MAEVRLKNVYKVYEGGVTAVKDFNLNIKDKEFVVFVGPSGCGKSTTLRMIAGLESITAGDIFIDDLRINNIEPRDRDIAMVFQNYALYPHMTVYKNMAFSLKLRKVKKNILDKDGKEILIKDTKGIKEANKEIAFYERNIEAINAYCAKLESKEDLKDNENEQKMLSQNKEKIVEMTSLLEKAREKKEYLENNLVPKYHYVHLSKQEINEKVSQTAKLLEIENLLDRKPKALSGGQRQRVAIGRAIVRNPKLFLMDEPLSNLDAKLRNQMRSELILLRKKLNTTFIYVTHDQTEAMTLGDRIVIMKDGVIQQIGTPNDLFNHPSNLFVAGFIGSPQMNFIDGSLDKDFKLHLVGKELSLSNEIIEKLKQSNVAPQDIVLGIRPEHISLCEEKDNNSIEGVISVVELMGSSLHLHIDTVTNKNIVIIVQIANMEKEKLASLVTGNKIYFKWNSGLDHLFCKETGSNLIPFESEK